MFFGAQAVGALASVRDQPARPSFVSPRPTARTPEPALPVYVRTEPARPSAVGMPPGTAVSTSASWTPPPRQEDRCPRNWGNSSRARSGSTRGGARRPSEHGRAGGNGRDEHEDRRRRDEIPRGTKHRRRHGQRLLGNPPRVGAKRGLAGETGIDPGHARNNEERHSPAQTGIRLTCCQWTGMWTKFPRTVGERPGPVTGPNRKGSTPRADEGRFCAQIRKRGSKSALYTGLGVQIYTNPAGSNRRRRA